MWGTLFVSLANFSCQLIFLPLLSLVSRPLLLSPQAAFSCRRRRPPDDRSRRYVQAVLAYFYCTSRCIDCGRRPLVCPCGAEFTGRVYRTGRRFLFSVISARASYLVVAILPHLRYYSSISSVLVRLDWKVAVVGDASGGRWTCRKFLCSWGDSSDWFYDGFSVGFDGCNQKSWHGVMEIWFGTIAWIDAMIIMTENLVLDLMADSVILFDGTCTWSRIAWYGDQLWLFLYTSTIRNFWDIRCVFGQFW